MRFLLSSVLLALIALPAAGAEDRAAKRALIHEVLDAMDAKVLIQDSLNQLFDTMMNREIPEMNELDAEGRAQMEAARKAELEKMAEFRRRLYTRLDYVKYAEEVYVPVFDEHFTHDELKELLTFVKTPAGQKLVAAISDLSIGAMMKGTAVMEGAASETAAELEREDRAKNPWKPTMADMRTIASAVEARATDTNDYPEVDFAALPSHIEPIYIRKTPAVDAWGTPFLYGSDGVNYRIVSAGADKRFEWNARQIEPEAQTVASEDLDKDIIFQNGTFVQHPKEANLEY